MKWFCAALAEQHAEFAERDEQYGGRISLSKPFRDLHQVLSAMDWRCEVVINVRQFKSFLRFGVMSESPERFS